jgi:hypothetical protein
VTAFCGDQSATTRRLRRLQWLSTAELRILRWMSTSGRRGSFPTGSLAKAQFEYLCSIGCDPRGLLSFLTVAVVTSREQKSIYDMHGASQSALKKLPERLEEISRELEAVNPHLRHYVSARAENPKRNATLHYDEILRAAEKAATKDEGRPN